MKRAPRRRARAGGLAVDADGILAGVAGEVWARDHDGAACPDHAIPKVGELAGWLPACPVDAIREAVRRVTWLHACFTPAVPDVARLDWRQEYHAPTSRWLAFGHALSALGYYLVRAEQGADGELARSFGEQAGAVGAPEFEAIDAAWRAVREPEAGERLAGWFDVTAGQSAAWLAADGLAPSVAAVPDTAGFIAAFPAAVARWRDTAARGWAGGVPDGHPLTPLVRAWQYRARDVEARDVVTVEVLGGRPLRLVRAPAYLDLSLAGPLETASIESIEVDGEPFATPQVGSMTVYRRPRRARGRGPRQLGFDGFAGPVTFDGQAVSDVVLATLAEHPLTGDERNPLRGDVVRVAKLAPALSGATVLTAAEGVYFLTRQGTVTEAALKRWNNAMLATSAVRVIVNPRTGQWRSLANVTERVADGEYAIAAPGWWLEQGGRGPEARYRLTGGLWREPLGDDGTRGLGKAYWGALERTIDGFEAALCWSRAPMKGKGGRIPELLRPERRGGPGRPLFVPWRAVLRCSGEFVPDDADAMSTHGRRYRRRVQALDAAGYVCQGGKPALAGDTVEVVTVQAGTRVHDAGLYIRGTARFCEAVAKARRTTGKGTEWTRIPAIRLLRPAPVGG